MIHADLRFINGDDFFGVEGSDIHTAGWWVASEAATTSPKIQIVLDTTTLTFEKEEVVNAVIVQEADPISSTIPINKLEFHVISDDANFNMFSGGYTGILENRPLVRVYEKVDGVDVLLGSFYLEDWENVSEDEYKFEAMDIIGVLNETPFEGQFWETLTPVSDILDDVLGPLEFSYSVDSWTAAQTIRGWIPPGTYRAALQQILFAAGAVAYTARDTEINIIRNRIYELPFYDVVVPDSAKFVNEKVSLKPLVTSIELMSHNYTKGTDQEDIFDEYLDPGEYKIVFDQPYYDLTIGGPGYMTQSLMTEDEAYYIVLEDGVTEIEVGGEYQFGPNSVSLFVDTGGTVTITGYKYVDSRRSFIFTEEGVTSANDLNKMRIPNATLVSADNAQEILELVRDYFRLRYRKEMKLLPNELKPHDLVRTSTLYDNVVVGTIEKMEIDLTRGFLADVRMISQEE